MEEIRQWHFLHPEDRHRWRSPEPSQQSLIDHPIHSRGWKRWIPSISGYGSLLHQSDRPSRKVQRAPAERSLPHPDGNWGVPQPGHWTGGTWLLASYPKEETKRGRQQPVPSAQRLVIFLCMPISDSTALVSLLFALKKAKAAGWNIGIRCLIEVGTRESLLNTHNGLLFDMHVN